MVTTGPAAKAALFNVSKHETKNREVMMNDWKISGPRRFQRLLQVRAAT
jgi:hypothetical protein